MEKQQLINLTETFLRAYGYVKKATTLDNAFLFTRPTGLGTTDDWLIYFHEKGREPYLDLELGKLNKKYTEVPSGDNGRRLFLATTPIGAVPTEIKKHGFIYQVPAWFFDREFSSSKELSALKELEKEIDRYSKERIEQLYQVGLTGDTQPSDILDTLIDDLLDPRGASLTLIIAPAGFGKTVLMASLYKELKDEFIKNKQKQAISQRPLLMLPGHIKGANNLDDLVDNFIGDEYDFGVANKETFKFWIKNNFAIWLLDGLEEFIVKIPDEFIYKILEDYLTAEDAVKPQIVISVREPLLSSSPELRESIVEWMDYGVKLYKLCKWQDKQKRAYFEKNLTIPREDKISFINETMRNAQLSSLCSTPYFCSLITNLKNNNRLKSFNNELELIEHSFEMLCEREFEPAKGLDHDILPVERQRELFKMLADIKIIDKREITVEEISSFSEIFLEGVEDNTRTNQLERIKRHALLTATGKTSYEFSDDIIKEYLTCLVLLDFMKRKDLSKFDKINELEDDSFLLRYLSERAANLNWVEIIRDASGLPSTRQDEAVAFRNILKVFLLTTVDSKENYLYNLLHNRNLSGLKFINLDLSGFDFSCSNLKNSKFINCILKRSNFDNCNFEDTQFKGCLLEGATSRGAYLKSVQIEDKKFYDLRQIKEQLFKLTKIPPDTKEPCQAVNNLIKILDKLIKKGKGYWLPKVFLERTKCEGGVPSKKCVDSLIKHKLLDVDSVRVKIKVNMFDSVKKFVLDHDRESCPDIIMDILNDICPDIKTGCTHLPD